MCLIALSRGLAPPSPLSFCQSFHFFFLQAAESGVFSKVRVCEAERSNESPSGAFKRQNGLAQQDGGARPDKFAFAQWSGAMKAPVGLLSDRTVLRKQDGGAPPRQVHVWCKNRACGGCVQTCKGLRQGVALSDPPMRWSSGRRTPLPAHGQSLRGRGRSHRSQSRP